MFECLVRPLCPLSNFESVCVCVCDLFISFIVMTFQGLIYFSLAAGMNGFLKAEFSNMWTATLRNKKSFKRPISEFTFFVHKCSFYVIIKYKKNNSLISNPLFSHIQIFITTMTKGYLHHVNKGLPIIYYYLLERFKYVALYSIRTNTIKTCWVFLFIDCLFSFLRDHYVEGKMRGLAPSKKIAAVQQKNVDL